jgi:hypothetical protein
MSLDISTGFNNTTEMDLAKKSYEMLWNAAQELTKI